MSCLFCPNWWRLCGRACALGFGGGFCPRVIEVQLISMWGVPFRKFHVAAVGGLVPYICDWFGLTQCYYACFFFLFRTCYAWLLLKAIVPFLNCLQKKLQIRCRVSFKQRLADDRCVSYVYTCRDVVQFGGRNCKLFCCEKSCLCLSMLNLLVAWEHLKLCIDPSLSLQ